MTAMPLFQPAPPPPPVFLPPSIWPEIFLHYGLLFDVGAFLLGAVVGSFLNVCIYRLPRGLSVNRPRRSFCPECGAPIAWYQNLPVLSWLFLRGRCARCEIAIDVRYPLVELLTALLFLGVWLRFRVHPAAVPGLWTLTAFLITAACIDWEHTMIPDSITLGGQYTGVAFCLVFPAIIGETSHIYGFVDSVFGMGCGYALLWLVATMGRLVFGRKNVTFDPPCAFAWTRHPEGGDADLRVGEERSLWSDHFARETDVINLICTWLYLDGKDHENVLVRGFYDRIEFEGKTIPFANVEEFGGTLRGYAFPREAMGQGDLKLMGAIGAFLGWQSVLFTYGFAAVAAALALPVIRLTGRRLPGGRLPFGPALVLAAFVWLFAGPELVHWYVARFF